MKKTLISTALALGFVGAAQAQMTLYGLVDVGYGKGLATAASTNGSKPDFHSGGDTGSSEGNSTTRFGIKGSMDLGGGLKGNFKFESGGIGSDGSITSSRFFNRAAWGGVSGGFGEVRIGRSDNVVFQTMIDFDLNGASNGVSAGGYSGVGVFGAPLSRQSALAQYITPDLGGFTGQLGYQAKTSVSGSNPAPRGAKDVVSLGGKFAAGDFAIGAAYQTKPATGTKDFASIAGTYDLKVAKLMLGYADGGKIASGGTGSGPTLGVNVPVGTWNFGAHYAENLDKRSKTKAIELWVNKEIFKNAYVYGEAGNLKTSVGTFGNTKTKANGYEAGLILVF